MKLFNTKTQQIESLQPIGDEITLCLCGLKPTETVKLNQAYLYCTMDVLVRYLEEMKGWPVKCAQLTTGVSGNETGHLQPPKNQWVGRFIEHMRSLNVRPPDYSSGSIDNYIAMIARYPGQATDLCMDSAQSPFGCDSAQTEPAVSQAPPFRFSLRVATIDYVEPKGSLWSARTLSD